MGAVSRNVDELARRLARLTGEDVETALARAIEERLSRVEASTGAPRKAALRLFFEHVSAMPVKDAGRRMRSLAMAPTGCRPDDP
jgi:hypothetical protein